MSEEDEAAALARQHARIADLERAIELGYVTDDVFIELHLAHWYCDDPEASLAALTRGIEALPTCSVLWRTHYDFRLELEDEAGAEAESHPTRTSLTPQRRPWRRRTNSAPPAPPPGRVHIV